MSSSNEKIIWDYLVAEIGNEYAAAGIMGNLEAESGMIPTNLQNSYEKKLGLSDAQYTEAVDSGKYKYFVNDSAGYGLCQWTYWTRKEALLKESKKQNKSIGDLTLQLDFLMYELSTSYSKVFDELKKAKTVDAASKSFMLGFERPANTTFLNQNKRANNGKKYYNKYHKKEEKRQMELDNKPDIWAIEAVEWAKKNNILIGDNNGNLKLHSPCTREEVLVFLERYDKNIK